MQLYSDVINSLGIAQKQFNLFISWQKISEENIPHNQKIQNTIYFVPQFFVCVQEKYEMKPPR